MNDLRVSGRNIRRINYTINPLARVMGGMTQATPENWLPCVDRKINIGERLPFNWDWNYINDFKQNFQPVLYFRNCSALTNYLSKVHTNTEQFLKASQLLDELFDHLNSFLIYSETDCYVSNNFIFKQNVGVNMPYGWVGALSNSFVILGCVPLLNTHLRDRAKKLITDLCRPFLNPYIIGAVVPKHWISCIDENSYIWFEEYPEPEGKVNFVLNGHIFSIYALHEASRYLADPDIIDLVKAGITTVRDNVQLFRRKDKINLYSLRGARKSDYLPARTIRQQCELYALSGDIFFKNMASTFYNDFKNILDIDMEVCFRHCKDSQLFSLAETA